MKQWKKAIVAPTASIRDTIEVINEAELQIAVSLTRSSASWAPSPTETFGAGF